MSRGRLFKALADLYGLLFFLMLGYLAVYGRLFNTEYWYAATHPVKPGVELPVGELSVGAMLVFLAIVILLQLIKRVDPSFVPELAMKNLNPGVELPVRELAVGAMLVFAAIVILIQLIKRVDPSFVPELAMKNLNLRPLFHPVLRYPFALLLVWNLPILATLEEFIFRDGMHVYPTVTWWDVVWRSLLFGLFHGLASWNWRGGLVQAVLGFWFSYQYLQPSPDPLLRASFTHFVIDALFFVPAALSVLLGGYRLRVGKPARPCS